VGLSVVVVVEFTIPARILPHRAVSLSDLRHRGRDSSVSARRSPHLERWADCGAKATPRIAHPSGRGPRVPESHRFYDYDYGNDNDNDRDGIRRLTDFRCATQLFG
jgi:hypothetical protein